jgi:hypothetical protein
MDEKGDLLSIEEVRERLIENKTLIVNPDANWNHKSSTTKDYYLDIYMAKNLYRFYSPSKSEFNYETPGKDKKIEYIRLFPLDSQINTFKSEYNNDPDLKKTFYNIHNSKIFWQLPGKN